jgi:hypothetical protein
MIRVVLLVLLLSGCSALQTALSLAQPASNGIAVDAELTVGDKQEEINTEVGRQVMNSNQAAESIENNINSVPLTFLVLLVLGWLLPSPNEIWKGLKGMVLFWRKKE